MELGSFEACWVLDSDSVCVVTKTVKSMRHWNWYPPMQSECFLSTNILSVCMYTRVFPSGELCTQRSIAI